MESLTKEDVARIGLSLILSTNKTLSNVRFNSLLLKSIISKAFL